MTVTETVNVTVTLWQARGGPQDLETVTIRAGGKQALRAEESRNLTEGLGSVS